MVVVRVLDFVTLDYVCLIAGQLCAAICRGQHTLCQGGGNDTQTHNDDQNSQ